MYMDEILSKVSAPFPPPLSVALMMPTSAGNAFALSYFFFVFS